MTTIAQLENFVCIQTEDTSGETFIRTIISSTEEEKLEIRKYNIYTLKNITTDEIIYSYKVYNKLRPVEKFLKIKDTIWWFGGGEIYTLRIFVNMITKEIFDPYKLTIENSSHAFIWTDIKLSTDNIICVVGCVWGSPNETDIYDISKIDKGEITNVVFQCLYDENNKNVPYEDSLIFDTFKDISIKYEDNKEIIIVNEFYDREMKSLARTLECIY